MAQGSNRNLSMTDPLITMAEQPSQASCKELSRLCPAASYRQIARKRPRGEVASLSNAQNGFPDLDPASRPKLRYRFLCQVSLLLHEGRRHLIEGWELS